MDNLDSSPPLPSLAKRVRESTGEDATAAAEQLSTTLLGQDNSGETTSPPAKRVCEGGVGNDVENRGSGSVASVVAELPTALMVALVGSPCLTVSVRHPELRVAFSNAMALEGYDEARAVALLTPLAEAAASINRPLCACPELWVLAPLFPALRVLDAEALACAWTLADFLCLDVTALEVDAVQRVIEDVSAAPAWLRRINAVARGADLLKRVRTRFSNWCSSTHLALGTTGIGLAAFNAAFNPYRAHSPFVDNPVVADAARLARGHHDATAAALDGLAKSCNGPAAPLLVPFAEAVGCALTHTTDADIRVRLANAAAAGGWQLQRALELPLTTMLQAHAEQEQLVRATCDVVLKAVQDGPDSNSLGRRCPWDKPDLFFFMGALLSTVRVHAVNPALVRKVCDAVMISHRSVDSSEKNFLPKVVELGATTDVLVEALIAGLATPGATVLDSVGVLLAKASRPTVHDYDSYGITTPSTKTSKSCHAVAAALCRADVVTHVIAAIRAGRVTRAHADRWAIAWCLIRSVCPHSEPFSDKMCKTCKAGAGDFVTQLTAAQGIALIRDELIYLKGVVPLGKRRTHNGFPVSKMVHLLCSMCTEGGLLADAVTATELLPALVGVTTAHVSTVFKYINRPIHLAAHTCNALMLAHAAAPAAFAAAGGAAALDAVLAVHDKLEEEGACPIGGNDDCWIGCYPSDIRKFRDKLSS